MTDQKDELEGMEEVKSNWFAKGKPGDFIKGTLVDIRVMDDSFNPGEKVTNYELLAHGGSFHRLDDKKLPVEEITEVADGEYWMVGGNKSINGQMRNIKIGQIVGIRFVEETPSKTKGFASAKVIKVYQGKMDEEWVKENEGGSEEISADDIGKNL